MGIFLPAHCLSSRHSYESLKGITYLTYSSVFAFAAGFPFPVFGFLIFGVNGDKSNTRTAALGPSGLLRNSILSLVSGPMYFTRQPACPCASKYSTMSLHGLRA